MHSLQLERIRFALKTVTCLDITISGPEERKPNLPHREVWCITYVPSEAQQETCHVQAAKLGNPIELDLDLNYCLVLSLCLNMCTAFSALLFN